MAMDRGTAPVWWFAMRGTPNADGVAEEGRCVVRFR